MPDLSRVLELLRHRGPDATGTARIGRVQLCHARLAIMDLDKRSDQPMRRGMTTICYNGELWNYHELRETLKAYGREFVTSGDTEVMAHALDHWGADALMKLEGMFAVAWVTDGSALWFARDRFGEVPAYYHHAGGSFSFASERHALEPHAADVSEIKELPPGHYVHIATGSAVPACPIEWYHFNSTKIQPCNILTTPSSAGEVVKRLLRHGVRDRLMGDVPSCMLLSGGIDSGAIAALTRELMEDQELTAYTAVWNSKSADLRRARETACMLRVTLHEVHVPMPTHDDLRMIVDVIEQPSKAQAEIGWACWCLAKQIHADGFKIVLSGEGSDELWASYAFTYHALKTECWHDYRRQLFLKQSDKNFARCNKIFMRHGIEARLPFLSTPLVELALSLPKSAVRTDKNPKAVMTEVMRCMLPESVLRAPKVAFQDGLGIKKDIEQMLAETGDDAKTFYRRHFNLRGQRATMHGGLYD